MPTPSRARWALLALVTALLLVLPAYLRAYTVRGTSGAPTILLGDTVLVNQAAYWLKLPYTGVTLFQVARPQRGALVQVLPPDRAGKAFKRVIGLPGETVEIRQGRVLINGAALPWKALPRTDFVWVPAEHTMGSAVFDEAGHWAAFTSGSGPNWNAGPVHLSSGQYYLLGDNRDVSMDCRTWGPLSGDRILGKVVFVMATGPRNQ